jgi:hypothetical protein
VVRRSGFRWLVRDGQLCRQGEAIAFCHVGLVRMEPSPGIPRPFAEEFRTVQMAIIAPVSGQLSHAQRSSRGGFFDQLDNYIRWNPDEVIGEIQPAEAGGDGRPGREVQLLMMAARRVAPLVESRAGLLAGWSERTRAARIDGPGAIGTLLALGVCELEGVIRGDQHGFVELLGAVEGPAHVVYVSDNPLVHSTPVIADQLQRTDAEREAIATAMVTAMASAGTVPNAADWVFCGAILNALHRSPASETYTVLAREGLREAGPPDAIVLSAHSEGRVIHRHRKLGFHVQSHDFRLNDAGPAYRLWLERDFEPVRRTIETIRGDYDRLIGLIRAQAPNTRILICNMMSTAGLEDVQSYAAFDEPLAETLTSVRANEMNLMLCDLARDHDIAVVDADAIAADLGGGDNLRDGVHQSGAMQTETRAEILRILRAHRVPGFGAAAS